VDRGHRRIGWISPSLSSYPAMRWAGYCECLKEAGLPYNPAYVCSETEAPMERQGGIAFRKLWSRADRPTAIVVYNDLMALSILSEARTLGVRIPEDLSIVSIDDIPEASMSLPALTTVAIGIEKLGGRAVRLLEEFVSTGTYRAEKVQVSNFVLKERATVADGGRG
jgi:LacI family transcriptional regulator